MKQTEEIKQIHHDWEPDVSEESYNYEELNKEHHDRRYWLTDDEYKEVMEFKKRFPNEKLDINTLCRFIFARNFEMDQAYTMLDNWLVFLILLILEMERRKIIR